MARRGTRDYKVVCDRTGGIFPASECKMEWSGLFVHKSVWDPRQPQDTLRASKDSSAPPIARPVGEPTFISATDVTPGDL